MHKPVADLRSKLPVSSRATDREVFHSLVLGDCWWDAELPQTFFYLYEKTAHNIPDSWSSVMSSFHAELKRVLWLQHVAYLLNSGGPTSRRSQRLRLVTAGHFDLSRSDRSA